MFDIVGDSDNIRVFMDQYQNDRSVSELVGDSDNIRMTA